MSNFSKHLGLILNAPTKELDISPKVLALSIQLN